MPLPSYGYVDELDELDELGWSYATCLEALGGKATQVTNQ